MKKILIGTHNKGKLKEISFLISKRIKKISPISLKIKSPNETGSTFISNSRLKASFFSKYRKPNPGMILYLAKKYNINLSKSYFVGDSDTDILAGKLANLKTILVKSIKFKNYKLNVKPNFNVKNLYEAVNLILKDS